MELHLCEASYLDHDIILFSSGNYLIVGSNSLETMKFGGIYKMKYYFVTTPRVVHKSGSIDKKFVLSRDLV